jgi:hypothetical protein
MAGTTPLSSPKSLTTAHKAIGTTAAQISQYRRALAWGSARYASSGTISIAPQGHSSTQIPQPLQ